MSAVQSHQLRVFEEADQLDDRIKKLEEFLKSENASSVDYYELILLVSQLQAMKTYSALLHSRMDYWKLTGG